MNERDEKLKARFLTDEFVLTGLGAKILRETPSLMMVIRDNFIHDSETDPLNPDFVAARIEFLHWIQLGEALGYFSDTDPRLVNECRGIIFRTNDGLDPRRFPKDFLENAKRLSGGRSINLPKDLVVDDRSLLPIFQAAMVLAEELTDGVIGLFLSSLRTQDSPFDNDSTIVTGDEIFVALHDSKVSSGILNVTDPLPTCVAGMLGLIELLSAFECLFPVPALSANWPVGISGAIRMAMVGAESVEPSGREALKIAIGNIVGWRLPIKDPLVYKRFRRAFTLLQNAAEQIVLNSPDSVLGNFRDTPYEAVYRLSVRHFAYNEPLAVPLPVSTILPPGSGGFGTGRGILGS